MSIQECVIPCKRMLFTVVFHFYLPSWPAMNGAQGLRTRDITQEIDEITQKKKKRERAQMKLPKAHRK